MKALAMLAGAVRPASASDVIEVIDRRAHTASEAAAPALVAASALAAMDSEAGVPAMLVVLKPQEVAHASLAQNIAMRMTTRAKPEKTIARAKH